MKKYWDQLQEAAEIAKERESQYGSIDENFVNISRTLEQMFGIDISPKSIVKVFIATKIARNKYKHKEDNILDAINYLAILNFLK